MTGERFQAQDMTQNPYVGPRAFLQGEHEYFFGRDEETAILEGLMLARPTVLLFSQSGAGKSSLLRAGLIHSLTRPDKVGKGERERIYQKMRVLPVASVGGALPPGMDGADVANVFTFSVLLSLAAKDEAQTSALAQMTLEQGLAPHLSSASDDPNSELDVLLIIDQFEELFTRNVDRWRDREGFFQSVAKAMQAHRGLRVLFSMREDYIAELTPYAGLLPDHLSSRFRLERLRPHAALDAVIKPAARADRVFPDDAARLLVQRLCRSQSSGTAESAPSVPADDDSGCFVEPVHLQVVCRQFWQRIAKQRDIRMSDVEMYGDVNEALASFYEDAVREAAARIGGREMLVRYWFEQEAITPTHTRGLVFKNRLDSTVGSLPISAVEVLDPLHVIRPMVRGNDTWYELAHDRLIQPVLQANQVWWLKQPRLVQAAKAWADSGRGPLPPIDGPLEFQIREASSGIQDSPVKEFVMLARAETSDEAQRDRLLERDLSEKGWGIIFAHNADPALRAALSELLTQRQDRAKSRFRIFAGQESGYRAGESAAQFLERHEAGMRAAGSDTERMPYYLLIVGSPTVIPFEFQYYLGINHAVGRIAFDTWQEYTNYARSVVAAETGLVALPRRAVLFAARNADDPATNYGYERLVAPLVEELHAHDHGWNVDLIAEQSARKENFGQLMEADWSLLFVSAHGMYFDKGDDRQNEENGAVLCQDWPGPLKWKGPIPPDFYFAARDLAGITRPRLLGTVAFLFGEFTAGTPRLDNFTARRRALNVSERPRQLADQPFLAHLAQRLLGHQDGGALAVIGHVDINWTTSFVGRSSRGQSSIGAFLSFFLRLMRGYPVGFALDEFRRRFRRELAGWAEMRLQVDTDQMGKRVDPIDFATQETAMIDLRNFVILGDPAVHLPVAEPGEAPSVLQPALVSSSVGMAMLKLHPMALKSLTWQPSGAYLLTVCSDGKARVWPEGVGDPWIISADEGDEIQVADWQYDGSRVATLSSRGILATWDVTGIPDGGVGPGVRVGDWTDLLVWQPAGKILASVHGRDLFLYDGDTGARLQTLAGHTGLIRSCNWSPDGTRLATTCRDAVLRVWDSRNGQLLQALAMQDPREKLGPASWSPDGRFLAYSTEKQPDLHLLADDQQATGTSLVCILDALSLDPIHEFSGHLGAVRVFSWRPSGDLLASISNDRAIVWDVQLGKQRFAVERSAMQITDTAYSPDGRSLWSTSNDQVVRLWEADSGAEFQQSADHGGQVTCVAWHPTGASIAVGRSDGAVVIVPREDHPQQIAR